MASVKGGAGVVTAVEVNGPMSMGPSSKFVDKDSAATWALIWFVVAVLLLFVVL